ncbi:MAG: hypothetical protein AAF570_10425 [Bacteroidota bacterium]
MSNVNIEFFDNYIPALEAGTYQITIEQDISGVDTEGYFDEDIVQNFEVQAPQFQLDSNLVHGAYPAANTVGDYAEVLPQIVLERPTLPWEREITGDTSIPWLALIVFQEDEIRVDPETSMTTQPTKVSDLLAADNDILKPAIDTGTLSQVVLDSTCQTITLRGEVFKALFPRQDELTYLAHVREVDTQDQIMAGAPDSGSFSTLIANRFPNASASDGGGAGSKNYVHLVSLEGFWDYLVDNPNIGNKTSLPSELKDVQVVSLFNWSFTASPEGAQSFADLMGNIVDNGANPDGSYSLKLPRPTTIATDQATQTAAAYLDMGYSPTSYATGTGENTFAWYRGPLTAQVAQPLPKPVAHYAHSSSAAIYLQDQGVFDMSYAAAWEMGRALALADTAFGANLLKFRRSAYQVLNLLMDKLSAEDLDSAANITSILNSDVVREDFDVMIAAGLSQNLQELWDAPVSRAKQSARPSRSLQSTDPVAETQAFLANPEVMAALQDAVNEDLLPVAAWLARLKLLYGVPFSHLVPQQPMLPVESVRFFYVDQNWLSALMDGALALGLESSRDSFFYQSMKEVIDDAVDAITQSVRAEIAGTSTGAHEGDSSSIEAMTGVLIRSDMVSGWSGLEVRGYQDSSQLKTLRMERLSSNVMLVLFLDVATSVEIAQPQQGLQFGVESNASEDWVVYLRNLTGNIGQATSTEFPASGSFTAFYRTMANNVGDRVLNVNNGAGALVPTMNTTLGVTMTPSQFALEMVKSPERFTFTAS